MRSEKGGRSAWLEGLFLLLAVCLVTAAGAVAADDSRGPKKPVSESSDDPAVRAATAAEMERARRKAERRATPEAKAERRRSRTAFKGASRAEAIEILKREGKPLVEPMPVGPTLQEDERIERYLSDRSAQVVDASGQTKFIESSSPMLAKDAGGKQKPIDLRLERVGDGYAPANTPASLRLSSDVRGGAALSDIDVGLRPVVSRGSEGAVVGEEKLFYPNVKQDTDFLIAPMSTGVETFSYLRSEDSPEDHALAFDLPDGAALRPLRTPDMGDAGYEVVVGDKRLATVSPPSAWDAEGQMVPVTAAVRDDRIEMRVPHRGGDYKYPVTLDPQVLNAFRFSSSGDTNWERWYASERDPWSNFGSYAGQAFWGNGLYLHMPINAYFPGGDWSQWAYIAYPQTTITKVDSHRLDHQSAMVAWTPGSGSCLRTYLWHSSTGGVNVEDQCLINNEYRYTDHRQTCWYWCENTNGPEDNAFVLNFQAQVAGNRHRDGYAKLGDAYIYMLDRRPPNVQYVNANLQYGGWVGNETRSGEINTADEGLGVFEVRLHKYGKGVDSQRAKIPGGIPTREATAPGIEMHAAPRGGRRGSPTTPGIWTKASRTCASMRRMPAGMCRIRTLTTGTFEWIARRRRLDSPPVRSGALRVQ